MLGIFFKAVAADIAILATGDTFTTVLALITANTAGYRLWLHSLEIGPGEGTPVDKCARVRIQRINGITAAGTPASTIATSAISKADFGSIDSLASAGINYGGGANEPTTFETNAPFEMNYNTRGGLMKEWSFAGSPKILQNSILACRVAPEDATSLVQTVTLEFGCY